MMWSRLIRIIFMLAPATIAIYEIAVHKYYGLIGLALLCVVAILSCMFITVIVFDRTDIGDDESVFLINILAACILMGVSGYYVREVSSLKEEKDFLLVVIVMPILCITILSISIICLFQQPDPKEDKPVMPRRVGRRGSPRNRGRCHHCGGKD